MRERIAQYPRLCIFFVKKENETVTSIVIGFITHEEVFHIESNFTNKFVPVKLLNMRYTNYESIEKVKNPEYYYEKLFKSENHRLIVKKIFYPY